MITKKFWNSLTSSSRKRILELIISDNFDYWYNQLKEPYNHDFEYDAIGRKLKEILTCCILQNDGSIKISICINPTYIKKEIGKDDVEVYGTDITSKGYAASGSMVNTISSGAAASNFSRTIKLKDALGESEESVVDKPTAIRVSNPTTVRCEIRYGMDDTVYKLVEVQIEYLKSPQFIRLT